MFEQYGLIQLGMAKPRIQKSGTVYVVTHPFWGDHRHPYIDKLEELLRESDSPILTLDWDVLLNSRNGDNTIHRYQGLNPNGDRFFLPNQVIYARPHCGWEKTAEVINGFEPEEVVFGGSQLIGNEQEGYAQCAGLSYEHLKRLVPNARIEESISDRVGYSQHQKSNG